MDLQPHHTTSSYPFGRGRNPKLSLKSFRFCSQCGLVAGEQKKQAVAELGQAQVEDEVVVQVRT